MRRLRHRGRRCYYECRSTSLKIKKMKPITLHLELLRTTKGKYVFGETTDDPMIAALYLPKSKFTEPPGPIEVTISDKT